MHILFVEAKTITPYDQEVMREEGIGGAEATLVRIASALAESGHRVTVAQLGRRKPRAFGEALRHVPLAQATRLEEAPDAVVVLRRHRLLPALRRAWPKARLVLWLHNWQRAEAVIKSIHAARGGATVVCVSDAHAAHTDRLLNGPPARLFRALGGAGGRIPVRRIYNPLDPDLHPDGTPWERDRLLFASTANKGLWEVIGAFLRVREQMPTLRLAVAGTRDPSFVRRDRRFRTLPLDHPAIEWLGRLPPAALAAEMRRALCLFYPQRAHAETFGLVFSEAHAVGTPVLAHPFGSAPEVVGDPEQLVDAADSEELVARLERWRAGARPRVGPRPEFALETVRAQWEALLSGAC